MAQEEQADKQPPKAEESIADNVFAFVFMFVHPAYLIVGALVGVLSMLVPALSPIAMVWGIIYGFGVLAFINFFAYTNRDRFFRYFLWALVLILDIVILFGVGAML